MGMNEGLGKFIEEAIMYNPRNVFSIHTSFYNRIITPYDFDGLTFDYNCASEDKYTSFKLDLSNRAEIDTQFEMIAYGVPETCVKKGKLDFTFHLVGKCQSCNDYHVDFLINVFTVDSIPKEWVNIHASIYRSDKDPKLSVPISIQKVGVNPEPKVDFNKIAMKFFDRESGNWYHKGLNAIANNYGIGSLAYFRRIIEKELMHIIKEIKELPDSHGLEIQILLDEHDKHSSVSTIYENIYQHLPKSLKSLGKNPIKLLYNQTSEALHSMTEQEAMEKSKIILQLLEFVIIKINEEKSDIKDLKEAIKGLGN
jgi:hypothetical protein